MELGNKVNSWIVNKKRNFWTSVRFWLHNYDTVLPGWLYESFTRRSILINLDLNSSVQLIFVNYFVVADG